MLPLFRAPAFLGLAGPSGVSWGARHLPNLSTLARPKSPTPSPLCPVALCSAVLLALVLGLLQLGLVPPPHTHTKMPEATGSSH